MAAEGRIPNQSSPALSAAPTACMQPMKQKPKPRPARKPPAKRKSTLLRVTGLLAAPASAKCPSSLFRPMGLSQTAPPERSARIGARSPPQSVSVLSICYKAGEDWGNVEQCLNDDMRTGLVCCDVLCSFLAPLTVTQPSPITAQLRAFVLQFTCAATFNQSPHGGHHPAPPCQRPGAAAAGHLQQ